MFRRTLQEEREKINTVSTLMLIIFLFSLLLQLLLQLLQFTPSDPLCSCQNVSTYMASVHSLRPTVTGLAASSADACGMHH